MNSKSESFIKGTTFLRHHQHKEARDVFTEGIKSNDPLCAVGLWYMSLTNIDPSIGVWFSNSQYENTIKRLIVLAEEENVPEAYYVLGKLYYDGGFGLPCNEKKGIKYIKKAVELGSEFALDFEELLLTDLSKEGFYSSFNDEMYLNDKKQYETLINHFVEFIDNLNENDVNEETFKVVKSKYLEIKTLQTKLNDFIALVDTSKPGSLVCNNESNNIYLCSLPLTDKLSSFLSLYLQKGYVLNRDDNFFGESFNRSNNFEFKTILNSYSFARKMIGNNAKYISNDLYSTYFDQLKNRYYFMSGSAKNETELNAIDEQYNNEMNQFYKLKNDVLDEHLIKALELNKRTEYILCGNKQNGPLLKALKDIGFDYKAYVSLTRVFEEFIPSILKFLERKRTLISTSSGYQSIYYSYVTSVPATTSYLSTGEIKKYAADICETVSDTMRNIVNEYFASHKASFVYNQNASSEGTGGVTISFFSNNSNRVVIYDWPGKGALYTTVHEFGHVYHNLRNVKYGYKNGKDSLAREYMTSPLVETFSQFMEIVGHNYMMKNNPINEDPLYLLDDYLCTIIGKVMGFYEGTHLENRLYWMIDNNVPFTLETVSKNIKEAARDVELYYGQSSINKKILSLFGNDSYYSIRYFVGIIIALLMAKKLNDEPIRYKEVIEKIISLPSDVNADELIKVSEINLKDQKEIRSLFSKFQQQIDEFIALTEPLLDEKFKGRVWKA